MATVPELMQSLHQATVALDAAIKQESEAILKAFAEAGWEAQLMIPSANRKNHGIRIKNCAYFLIHPPEIFKGSIVDWDFERICRTYLDAETEEKLIDEINRIISAAIGREV